MTHVGCGGQVVPDRDLFFEYERGDGKVEKRMAYRCVRCGETITGNGQIDLDSEEEVNVGAYS